MPDSQQKAVYAWESRWRHWVTPSDSKHKVRKAIRHAEKLYRIAPAIIQFRTNSKSGGKALPSQYSAVGVLSLRPHHTNIPIALHETAHAIIHRLFGWDPDGMEDHGPQWLGVYIYLLDHFGVAPLSALEASAREHGLKWCGPGWVGPTKIRRRYRGAVRRAKDFWE